MADEKLFDLVTKMYVDIQEGFSQVNGDLLTVNNKMTVFESDLLESKKILCDGYACLSEKIKDIEHKIDNIQCDINTLTAKTYSADTKIIEISKRIK